MAPSCSLLPNVLIGVAEPTSTPASRWSDRSGLPGTPAARRNFFRPTASSAGRPRCLADLNYGASGAVRLQDARFQELLVKYHDGDQGGAKSKTR
jgi:hypothetical protein